MLIFPLFKRIKNSDVQSDNIKQMSRKAKGCEAKFGRAHLSQDFTFDPWHNVKQKIIILTSFHEKFTWRARFTKFLTILDQKTKIENFEIFCDFSDF